MTTTPTPGQPTALKPAAMPFGKEDPLHRRKMLIAGVGGVALVVTVALLFVFHPWRPTANSIRLTDEPAKVAQAVATEDFTKMPFERREIYMKMMDAKKTQLTQAHVNGQLNDVEYEKAMEAAHLGKRLDEMKKYFARPVGAERAAYLDKIINKKEVKTVASKKDATAKEEKKEEDLFRSSAAEETEIASWPPDVQAKYTEFKTAYEERKKLYKAAHPKPEKPTAAVGAATSTTP